MKRLNDSKITLLLLAFVLALMLTAASANADFTFGEPINLKSIIPFLDPAQDIIGCFSYDGLEMYVTSGSGHENDLRVLRRVSKDEDWGPPENLGPTVNSPSPDVDDSMPSISADGLTLYFHSNRPGGRGKWDIYMTTRATKNASWGPPVNLGQNVNSSSIEVGAWISANGLELYFHSFDRPGGCGGGDIWVTSRVALNDPWGQPVNLGPVVNSAQDDVAPFVSPDGLLLLFSDSYGYYGDPVRAGGYGGGDVWMTRRASLSAPWQTPLNLGPKVNSYAHDITPRISPDGHSLYFWTAWDGQETGDNWQVPILPIVDFNADGIVDAADVCIMIENWLTDYSLCDIGPMPWGDGVVDVQDLIVLSEHLFEQFPTVE